VAKSKYRPLANGALAGFMATVPMTIFLLQQHRRLPAAQQYKLPPRLIIDRAMRRLGLADYHAESTLRRRALTAHFLFGALCGALYATLERHFQRAPVAAGTLYGLLVWAASYLGWVPALNLMPPATLQPRERNLMMIIAHVVWGASMGGIFRGFGPSKARTGVFCGRHNLSKVMDLRDSTPYAGLNARSHRH
jgi:hypothetical protein